MFASNAFWRFFYYFLFEGIVLCLSSTCKGSTRYDFICLSKTELTKLLAYLQRNSWKSAGKCAIENVAARISEMMLIMYVALSSTPLLLLLSLPPI